MSIDVHCHIIPQECMDLHAVGPDGREYGVRLERLADGSEVPVFDGHRASSVDAEQLWNIDRRLREMDASGVDLQALSVPPMVFFYQLAARQAAGFARQLNDGIAAVVKRHPDRFIGMATVPLQDTDLALTELERAVGELGMRGVAITSNVAGENLDAPRLFPFFERVQALEIPIFIHPNNVAGQDRLLGYYLTNLLGNPVDTAIAAASLVFGGVLARLPRLKIILAHGGGATPFLCGRWEHGWHARPEPKRLLDHPPMADVRRFYFDTITHSPEALAYLVQTFGAGHVLIGTDYHFDMGDTRPLETVTALGLSDNEREQIVGGTAAWLFNLAQSSREGVSA